MKKIYFLIIKYQSMLVENSKMSSYDEPVNYSQCDLHSFFLSISLRYWQLFAVFSLLERLVV